MSCSPGTRGAICAGVLGHDDRAGVDRVQHPRPVDRAVLAAVDREQDLRLRQQLPARRGQRRPRLIGGRRRRGGHDLEAAAVEHLPGVPEPLGPARGLDPEEQRLDRPRRVRVEAIQALGCIRRGATAP